jgi:hypothetical protein
MASCESWLSADSDPMQCQSRRARAIAATQSTKRAVSAADVASAGLLLNFHSSVWEFQTVRDRTSRGPARAQHPADARFTVICLGWIHTHPFYSSFLSSRDLHTREQTERRRAGHALSSRAAHRQRLAEPAARGGGHRVRAQLGPRRRAVPLDRPAWPQDHHQRELHPRSCATQIAHDPRRSVECLASSTRTHPQAARVSRFTPT